MKTAKLRQIGGSKGVLLSKAVLELVDLGDSNEFEVEAKDGSIVLTPLKSPLDEFANFFKNNPNFEPDSMLIEEDKDSSFDDNDWTW